MFKPIAFTAAAAAAALFIAGPAFAAAPAVSLQGEVKLEKTVVENGAPKKVLVTPQKVLPGDKLVFSTSYRNGGATTVDHFVVTNPLPKGVVFSSDGSANAEVSVDGGKTWGALANLRVADGKGGQRAAQAGDVTHVRWTVATIAPGASGAVSYHAVVR